MKSQNKICSLRFEVGKGKLDDEFTAEEVKRAIGEFKKGDAVILLDLSGMCSPTLENV